MNRKRGEVVPRPVKLTEFEIYFASNAAEREWRDLRSAARNALADAYDYLTAHPESFNADRCYRLRGNLATAVINGTSLPQWQYKITDGARLWYAVEHAQTGSKKPGRVFITKAASGHPNETDPNKKFR